MILNPKQIREKANEFYEQAIAGGKTEEEANTIYQQELLRIRRENRPPKDNKASGGEKLTEVTEEKKVAPENPIEENIDVDIPKGLNSDETPKEIKHPFAGETVKRDYSATTTDAADTQPIPEADIATVAFDDGSTPLVDSTGTSTNTGGVGTALDTKPTDDKSKTTGGLPRNPEIDALDAADKRKAAKSLAEIAVNAYVWLNDAVKKNLQYSEFKMQNLRAKGKIDIFAIMHYPIGTESGEQQTLREFIDSYNIALENTYVCKEEWQQKVISLLTEIFIKKGWGFTEENSLLYYMGKDILEKAMTTISMTKTMNLMLKSINEYHLKATASSEPKAEEQQPRQEQRRTEQTTNNQSTQQRSADYVDAEVVGDRPSN